MQSYIKDTLKAKGMTQQQLADLLGVSRPSISATISRPSFPTLERIASALNVEPWQLLAPPSVVADVERSRQARAEGNGCPLIGVVRVGADNYTANNLAELRALVERLEQQATATAAPHTFATNPHP